MNRNPAMPTADSHAPSASAGQCCRRAVQALGLMLIMLVTPTCLQSAEPSPAATTVYVTDELRLGLYPTEETSGRATKTLVSGTRLEILERALRSIQVRTEEGDEGWVRTTYVVEAEPARRRLASLEAERLETSSKLDAREAELAALRDRLATTEAALVTAERGITELPALRDENRVLQDQLEARDAAVAPLWLGVAALAALLLGCFIGYRWLDRKVRRQFGGVRVY